MADRVRLHHGIVFVAAGLGLLAGCVDLPAGLPPFPDAVAEDGSPAPDVGPDAGPHDGAADDAVDAQPPVEACNGLDDDGDGRVDEGFPRAADDARDLDDPSRCRPLVERCVDGVPDTLADRFEVDERACDGLDNDCDGEVDEASGLACTWCDGAVEAPPCNGCPDRTVVPPGYVCVPPGSFTMGSPPGQPGRADDEGPPHRVETSRPYLIARDELNQLLWSASAGDVPNPSWFSDGADGGPCADIPGACPVERVSWYDALLIANRRSTIEGLLPCYRLEECEGTPFAGCAADAEGCVGDYVCRLARRVDDCNGYRLPTEAEWERAARAGSDLRYWRGDGTLDLAETDVFGANSEGSTRPFDAGQPANAFGLRDVHGNVEEWVFDAYGPYPPDGGAVVDPVAVDGDTRVARGGAWDTDADACRSAHRSSVAPELRGARRGLRLARDAHPAALVVVPADDSGRWP